MIKKEICEIDKRFKNDNTEKIERQRKEDEYYMTSCARIVDSSNAQFLVCLVCFYMFEILGFNS